MGRRFQDTFPEVAHNIMPVFAQADATRKAAPIVELPLYLKRNHFLEECFFDGSLVPVLLQDGTVGGIYNSVQEVTRQKLSDRRTKMLNLISGSADRQTSTSVYAHIADCLSTNTLDIPFALLWQVENEYDDGNHELTQIDSLGFPRDAKLKPQSARLHDSTGFMPLLRAARSQATTTAFDKDCGNIDWNDVQWAGHGEQSQFLTTLPLLSTGRLHGFLLVGNNPRRPVNEQYHQFMSDLQRHATSAVAATIGAEEAMKRNQRLQEQLLESERQIRYMAQHSDIGMMQLALDGTLIWANEHYHKVINQQDPTSPRQTFIAEDQLLAGDRTAAMTAWQQVLQGQKAQTTELRLQREYSPPVGDRIPVTILLSAFPYMEMGQVKSIMACMTEVSRLKWAESWQAQLAQNAKEAKRQQSEFTDAISHEVRNPLSAILQLADSIAESTKGLEEPTIQDCMNLLDENVEAARTILSCANHQKRIVDDVLTLSRMDYASIRLSPVPTHPESLVQDAMRIFEAEVAANSISLHTVQDPSIQKRVPHQVMCDPLRITQILVNLLSNAIKFTKQETRRSITVTYGATESSPRRMFSQQVEWAPQRRIGEDSILGSGWGDGEALYLTFTVEDTGPGMTPEALTRVFNRFEQATPRTSTKYGGSGLGLFISHSLTEKQGGEIGATSIPGRGSTFAFYIKAQKTRLGKVQPSNGLSVSNDLEQPAFPENGESAPVSIPPHNRSKRAITAPSNAFHLLLVEDNIINQQILRKQLTNAGCTVHVANHGVEALNFLRTSSLWGENHGQGPHLDVILMDWEMPVMDGLTCTREIRSLESSGHFATRPEVIAVTANVRPEQVQIAEEAGMDALVPKPFVVSELLQMIAKRLKR
ncbi:hypothetical protein PMZ80_010262 [Knufia obscura]|uniref:histidine kinase n=2 Tax=Knufia TaxID=430999 RepID=A0AAN8I5I1_9EURO|nr:hypothetical protein PMZ80_010262 [Knufia obscura]KAK5952999.1 hypothetical protein OHC33_006121 [Knufia fluminis]